MGCCDRREEIHLVPSRMWGILQVVHLYSCCKRILLFQAPGDGRHLGLRALDEFQDGGCFRFDYALHHQLSGRVPNRNGDA